MFEQIKQEAETGKTLCNAIRVLNTTHNYSYATFHQRVTQQ